MKTRPSASPEYGDWPGGTVTLVDGGMLSNFPIQSFDRADQATVPVADVRHQAVGPERPDGP